MSVTYILSATNSDLTAGADFHKLLTTTTESGTDSGGISIAGSSTEDSYGNTASGVPNLAQWPSGDWTVSVRTGATGGLDRYLSIAIARIDASGVVQETSSFTAEQGNPLSANTTYTFNLNGLSWSSGNATDRLRVIFRYRNGNAAARSTSITYGTTSVTMPTASAGLSIPVAMYHRRMKAG